MLLDDGIYLTSYSYLVYLFDDGYFALWDIPIIQGWL